MTRFFFTAIQLILFIDNTKHLHARQTMIAGKAIGNTIKKPIIKTFANTIKKSLGMFRRNKNSIKNLSFGLEEKYLRIRHSFGKRPVKYLREGGIKKSKYTAPQTVRGGKELLRTEGKKDIWIGSTSYIGEKQIRPLIKKSAQQMKGQELGSLINMVSKSKPQLPFLFATGGLGRLIQYNLVDSVNVEAVNVDSSNVEAVNVDSDDVDYPDKSSMAYKVMNSKEGELTTWKGIMMDSGGKTEYREFLFDALNINEDNVLIDVHSSIINPSDLQFLEGNFPTKKNFPTIVGFEGSGKVIYAGKNAQELSEKNVCFKAFDAESTGSYADHAVVKSSDCIALSEDTDLEQAAGFVINPSTMYALIDTAKENLTRNQELVLVNTGAAGGVGKLLIDYCIQNNIKLINVVRKEENVDQIKKLGAEYVLNSSSETYKEEMKKMFEELKPTVCLDCVSGKIGSDILRNMAPYSTLIGYGSLIDEPYDLTAKELLANVYTMVGMSLMTYFNEHPEKRPVYNKRISQDAIDGKLKTVISKKFKQKDFREAIEYYKQNMSDGKVILQP